MEAIERVEVEVEEHTHRQTNEAKSERRTPRTWASTHLDPPPVRTDVDGKIELVCLFLCCVFHSAVLLVHLEDAVYPCESIVPFPWT